MENKDVYMNRVQQRFFYAAARDRRVLGARRVGKTDGIIGPAVWAIASSMDRGAGAWLGSSKKQLFTRTVPGTIAAIERFYGLKEGVHFGWGRPPRDVPQCIVRPKSYENVLWFANGFLYHLVSLAVMGSANSFTFNSIIGDECKFLPKNKIDGEVMPALSGITHPLGDRSFSEWNPYYKSTLFASDASLTNKNNWLEKEEERLNDKIAEGPFAGYTYQQLQDELNDYSDTVMFWNELLRDSSKTKHEVLVVSKEEIARIHALVRAVLSHEGPYRIIPSMWKDINAQICRMLVNYKLVSEADAELVYNYRYLVTPEQHLRMLQIRKSKKYAEHLRQLRCNSFYYLRANTLDNIDILGEDYIRRMKRDLPPLVFMISILNQKVRKSNDGFYINLDIENVHGYIPDDCPAIDSAYKIKQVEGVVNHNRVKLDYEAPDFAELSQKMDCTLDADLVDSLPLHIAADYNALINWFVIGQPYRRDGIEPLNIINSMFVKNEQKIHALCAKFNAYYAPHKAHNRVVYYYYDATAKFSGYAIEGSEDFCTTIINELSRMGWDVIWIDMGKTPTHEDRYKVINEGLAGYGYPAVRFNRENNEALIMAMENCGVQIGYKGFRKDKSGEKLTTESSTPEGGDNITPAELRTDGTDAFDQLYWGYKFFYNRMTDLCMPSGH